MIVHTLRCTASPCGRPVDPVRGGAWCAEHTPVDLTGGVAPHDVPAPVYPPTRSGAPTRMRPGGAAETLRAAGWTLVATGPRADYQVWREPTTGAVRRRDAAVRLARCAEAVEAHRRAEVERWAALRRAGSSVRAIAWAAHVPEAIVRRFLAGAGVVPRPGLQ